MSEIDPAAVMAAHEDNGHGWCAACERYTDEDGHCEPYRLAEALAAERAKVARVEALFAGGPDTPCRTTWAETMWDRVECVEVPINDLRAALADQPEQDQSAANGQA